MVQSEEEYKRKAKKRRLKPENLKKEKARKSKPENVKKRKLREKDPVNIAKRKTHQQKSNVKAKRKLRESTPEYKKREKQWGRDWRAKPENVKKEKERQSSTHYKEIAKKRREIPEIKLKLKEREQRPEYRAKKRKDYEEIRLKVLHYYSKRLSKSEIPCCNCCGLNSHILFLAIDHIAGKHKMDSELRLVKLGYSSKIKKLAEWILRNGYPKGFQILCHSCNHAKGHSKNNKCPLKNKPH